MEAALYVVGTIAVAFGIALIVSRVHDYSLDDEYRFPASDSTLQ